MPFSSLDRSTFMQAIGTTFTEIVSARFHDFVSDEFISSHFPIAFVGWN